MLGRTLSMRERRHALDSSFVHCRGVRYDACFERHAYGLSDQSPTSVIVRNAAYY